MKTATPMLLQILTFRTGHISWHAEAGLQMQFITRPEIIGNWEQPQANKDLCLAEGLEKGARIDDSVYFGNFG